MSRAGDKDGTLGPTHGWWGHCAGIAEAGAGPQALLEGGYRHAGRPE